MEIPRIPASFTGSGDLFSASFLIWSHILAEVCLTQSWFQHAALLSSFSFELRYYFTSWDCVLFFYFQDAKLALEQTVNTTYAVLIKTYDNFKDMKDVTSSDKELRIIESKGILEAPPTDLKAEVVLWWTLYLKSHTWLSRSRTPNGRHKSPNLFALFHFLKDILKEEFLDSLI